MTREHPRRWTVQQRMLALTVSLMAFALLLTGSVSYALQYRAVNNEVQSQLLLDVDHLRQRAQDGPEHDGVPFTDLSRLFLEFMGSSVSPADEAMMAMIDGQVVYVSGGTRDFDIAAPDVVSTVTALQVPDGRARRTSVTTQGTDLELIAADVRLPGEVRAGTFVVAADIGARRADVTGRALTFLGLAIGAVLLAAGLAHVLGSRLLRPLRELREATGEISTDDLTRRVAVTRADTDVAELAVRFNAMLDRLEDGVRQQRDFLDDAAHELRTPLTILRGNAELLQPDDPADVQATRALLLDEVDRMQRLVDDLLMLARSQRPDFLRLQEGDVAELVVETMDRITALGARAWRLHADADGRILLDRQRVIQAVVQLAANAVRFSAAGSVIELESSWQSGDLDRVRDAGAEPAERFLALSVRDQGVGIQPEQQRRIFERFAQDDDVRSDGSGLGLSIVAAIAAAHGGAVTVESEPGAGATFTLWLPARGPVAG